MRRSEYRFLSTWIILLLFLQGQILPSEGYSFQSPQPLETTPGLDVLPSTLQASDGTLWVVWESYRSVQPNIYAKTYNGLTWSTSFNITVITGNTANIQPSISQLRNGTITLVWSTNVTGTYQLNYRTQTGGVWTRPVILTSGPVPNHSPATAVAPDGALWLVWYRQSPGATCVGGLCRQLYYKTLRGNVWSGEIQLTTDATWKIDPDVIVAKDGRVFLAFAKWTSSGSDWDVYYRTFSDQAWSGDIPLAGAGLWDTGPDFSQDRNGTIWLFWAREENLPGSAFQDKLWYKFSGDAGNTWSVDRQLTFGGTSADPIDDREPSAVQAPDKSLWIFYSSDLTDSGSDFNIHYIKTNPIVPIHDVAVAGFQHLPFQYRGGLASIGQNALMKLNVTVANPGEFAETVQVSLTVSNTTSYSLGPQTVSVAAGTNVKVAFLWDTTNVPLGLYTLSAIVSQVPGENSHNTPDNTLTVTKAFRVGPWADINQDGSITLVDVSLVFFGYGSTPGNPAWNPLADINGTGIIDLIDAGIAAASFGLVS